MLRRLFLAVLLGAFVLPVLPGCSTNRPYIWSWPHNKRRVLTVFEDLHELHMDIDRIIFDMDERPIEDID